MVDEGSRGRMVTEAEFDRERERIRPLRVLQSTPAELAQVHIVALITFSPYLHVRTDPTRSRLPRPDLLRSYQHERCMMICTPAVERVYISLAIHSYPLPKLDYDHHDAARKDGDPSARRLIILLRRESATPRRFT